MHDAYSSLHHKVSAELENLLNKQLEEHGTLRDGALHQFSLRQASTVTMRGRMTVLWHANSDWTEFFLAETAQQSDCQFSAEVNTMYQVL